MRRRSVPDRRRCGEQIEHLRTPGLQGFPEFRRQDALRGIDMQAAIFDPQAHTQLAECFK